MRVTEVSTVVRYSAEAKGAWRSIEVGATAALTSSDETLEVATQELYHRLGQQLKTLWSNGNSKDSGQERSSSERSERQGHQTNAQPAQKQSGPDASQGMTCDEHGVAWKRREKDGNVWYSHQIKGTRQWCNAPQT